MPRVLQNSLRVCLLACVDGQPALPMAPRTRHIPPGRSLPQDTGFLNRRIELHGVTYRFQVYLPEEWRRNDGKQWPIILFLHGRGERGSEGMWQTQIGLPEAVRDHPERWPFVIVMPQCPQAAYWTDPAMLDLAMAALDQEIGRVPRRPGAHLSDRPLDGRLRRLGAGAPLSAALGRSSHCSQRRLLELCPGALAGGVDPARRVCARAGPHAGLALSRQPRHVVSPRQSELMFDAFKAAGGHVRLWVYQGLKHDCWTRAYNEPELPRWLLAHHGCGQAGRIRAGVAALAERLVVPLHPPAIKLAAGGARQPGR